jgi:anti-sigma factor RsiW
MLLDIDAMTAFHCDADSAAEAYVMNRMPTKERNRFKLHLKRCACCRLEVAGTAELMRAIRAAYGQVGAELKPQAASAMSA